MHRANLLFTVALGLVLAIVLIPSWSPTARGEILESTDLNYEIETPPGWVRLPKTEAWPTASIVVGAIRQLDTLKDKSPGKGEGAQLHLAITDLPEGKTLEDMAEDPEVRGFLMKRFGEEPSSWPDVDVVSQKFDSGLAICVLTAEGKSPNLMSKSTPTRAVMILSTAKKKLYKLRMYAWPTEFDAEGLKDDLDVIEMNFDIPDLRDTPSPERPGERPPMEDEPEEVPEGDEDKETVVQDELVGWKLTKPKGIKQKEDFDSDTFPDVVAWFEDSGHVGSYQIILTVVARGQKDEATGLQAQDHVLKAWGLDPWWASFNKDHRGGPVMTFGWPRKAPSFITLPVWKEEKVVFATPKKRPKKPAEVKAKELIKKHKVAEKVKWNKLGKEKVIEAYRGVLAGTRPRFGREIVIRYVWGTPRLTCFMTISLMKDATMKWGDKIRALLESIEMTGRPSRR